MHEAPIGAANAASRRPANGRSCCWRSRPPDLCWDWLTDRGEDQKTEGEGSLQYIPNIPNAANSLRALSQETPISLGSSSEGLGAGQQDGGLGHTGGWLIEIVVWKDGAIKGFAFAGWKCVTCWVISQYGFSFNKPPRRNTNTANETHVFTTHARVKLSSKRCRRSRLLSRALTYVFQWHHRKRILHSPQKHNGVKPATSPHLQPPPARHVWSSIQNQRKNYMVTLDWTSVVNQNGFSKFLFFMQRIPFLALTADILKPRKPKQTFAVPGPGQQCSQSWRKWEDCI